MKRASGYGRCGLAGPGVLVGLAFGATVLLAGCAGSDPFARAGTWHENDAPMHNIAVEMVPPAETPDVSDHRRLSGEIAVGAIEPVLRQTGGGSGSAAGGSTGGSAAASIGGTSLGTGAMSAGSTP